MHILEGFGEIERWSSDYLINNDSKFEVNWTHKLKSAAANVLDGGKCVVCVCVCVGFAVILS